MEDRSRIYDYFESIQRKITSYSEMTDAKGNVPVNSHEYSRSDGEHLVANYHLLQEIVSARKFANLLIPIITDRELRQFLTRFNSSVENINENDAEESRNNLVDAFDCLLREIKSK